MIKSTFSIIDNKRSEIYYFQNNDQRFLRSDTFFFQAVSAMNGLQDVVSMNKCFKKQAKEENVWTAKETRLVSIAIGAKQITTNRRSKMKKVEPHVNHVSVMSQVSLSVVYGKLVVNIPSKELDWLLNM